MEEIIKLEDNNIHQSGTALEKCLTDSPFTGSSEHIECNRILLISCEIPLKFCFYILKIVANCVFLKQVRNDRPIRVR